MNRNISISDEEQRTGVPSPRTLRLALLLLHGRGYVILENAIALEFVASVQAAFSEIYRDCQASPDIRNESPQISSENTAVFWAKSSRIRVSPKLRPPLSDPLVVANPFVVAILSELLGKNFYCKSVSSDTCLKGALLQSPHRDIEFYKTREPYGYIVNIPIMYCGPHNGPLEVWPGGSHLWNGTFFQRYGMEPNVQDGRNPPIEAFSEHVTSEKLVLKPGDILIRDPGMWHRGTPSLSDEPRTMLTISYFRRDYFYRWGDPYYNLDRQLFEDLDARAKKLFDYAFTRTSLLYWRMYGHSAFISLEKKPVLGAPVRWLVRKVWSVRLWRMRKLSRA